MEIPGYEIQQCIGQGGMASAYLAKQTSLDRQVVLKVLDTAVTESNVVLERFLNEGRLVASLHHPHIITTYDIGTAGNDVYISMEYVEGGDLKQRLKERVFTPNEAIELIKKIASGLAAAHEKGIVHRDVKPGNILFRGDDTPLLSDFGIAKRYTEDADLTATGMFVGSPNYMAPEQSEVGPVDGRADIYALGVIFYEMLTGRKPYYSESVIDVILQHKRAPVPELPAGLENYQEFLNLAMAKDRNDRFRDANSLIHFLEQLSNSQTVTDGTVTMEPDFDVTGAMPHEVAAASTRVQIRQAPRISRPQKLAAVASVCAIAYGVLLLLENRINDTAPPSSVAVADNIELLSVPPAGPAESLGPVDGEQVQKVAAALKWLGQHSLNEYRLTAPPKDNAYYYFSRLLQMDPSSEDARRGLLEISASYAILAERAIADGQHEEARRYITIGLQVNPKNQSLLVLRDIATPTERGFLASIFEIFK